MSKPDDKQSIWKKEITLGRRPKEKGIRIPAAAEQPVKPDSVAELLRPLAEQLLDPVVLPPVTPPLPGRRPVEVRAPEPEPQPEREPEPEDEQDAADADAVLADPVVEDPVVEYCLVERDRQRLLSAEADGVCELLRVVDPADLERAHADPVVRDAEPDRVPRQLVLAEEGLERGR